MTFSLSEFVPSLPDTRAQAPSKMAVCSLADAPRLPVSLQQHPRPPAYSHILDLQPVRLRRVGVFLLHNRHVCTGSCTKTPTVGPGTRSTR